MNETCILTPLTADNSNSQNRIQQYEKLLQYLRDFYLRNCYTSSDPSLEDILQK